MRRPCQGEGMCADAWSASGLECVVLRPPGVWEPATYGWIAEQRRLRPSFEWDPFWEYGAFVDVRDLATAVGCALVAEYRGPAPMAVAAEDSALAHVHPLWTAPGNLPC